jgi:hypothetical protein
VCKHKKIRYPCATCGEPTHFLLLDKDLCPQCYALNGDNAVEDVVEKKDRTIH